MKYFIEESHTEQEWVYKRSHTLLLGVIFTLIIFISAIISIVIGTSLGATNSTLMFFVFLLISLFLVFFIAFAVIEWLGKGWTILKRSYIAAFKKSKVETTFEGSVQIIRFPKK